MFSTEYIIGLYRRYQHDLRKVRRQQFWFLRVHFNTINRGFLRWGLRQDILHPMLDDVEAEISYLLIRDRDPKRVLEMSPNTGWSSTWILSALRDNGGKGQLWSYDLHDTCTRYVPTRLSNGVWHFVKGDVRTTLRDRLEFDYYFIDSDHSKEFAQWYAKDLLPRIKPDQICSVHDVYHDSRPSEEGEVVLSWLRGVGRSSWTASRAANPEGYAALLDERRSLGMSYLVHKKCQDNSMMFLSL